MLAVLTLDILTVDEAAVSHTNKCLWNCNNNNSKNPTIYICLLCSLPFLGRPRQNVWYKIYWTEISQFVVSVFQAGELNFTTVPFSKFFKRRNGFQLTSVVSYYTLLYTYFIYWTKFRLEYPLWLSGNEPNQDPGGLRFDPWPRTLG